MVEVRLAEHRNGFGEIAGGQLGELVGVHVEDEDACARRTECRAVGHEEPLVDRVEIRARRKVQIFLAERREGETPPYERPANRVVGASPERKPVLVELIDVVAAIAVMSDEEAVMDPIQGHASWSPNAVARATSVGDAADEGGVAHRSSEPRTSLAGGPTRKAPSTFAAWVLVPQNVAAKINEARVSIARLLRLGD